MFRIFAALCTIVLFVALTPTQTRADPIVITSGTLTVTGLAVVPCIRSLAKTLPSATMENGATWDFRRGQFSLAALRSS